MNLRVTVQTMVSRALVNIRRATDQLGVLQQQASTGKRVLSPSDDPLAAVKVLSTKAQDDRLGAYLTNIQGARTGLNVSESALREAGSVLARAQQVAIEGSHSGNSPAAQEVLAQEIDGLLGRLLDQANTQHAGQYVFSGTAGDTPTFTVTRTDSQGRPQAVTYGGGDDRALVPIGQGMTVPAGYVGRDVFQQTQRGTTVYTGDTGAAAGTGTDSATGSGTLLVRHTATAYTPGSGVQPGTSSAAGDTIIGPTGAHRLTVDGTAGTVSLDGGPSVSFTSTDTDLKVSGPNGEVVFLDTTGIAPGFSGVVDITADGTLSIDAGATSLPIAFNANQVLTDSGTGAVTNVDSTGIRRTGMDHLEYPGTYDAFGILMAVRDDLRNTRGLNDREQAESLSRRLDELERVRSGILEVAGEQGVTLQNLDGVEGRASDLQLELRKRTSDLEGIDLAEAVLALQSQQNLLQMTLASSARMFDQSLLDFIH